MSLSYSFQGQSVLITGGTRGIGRHLVQRLVDGGARVVCFVLGRNVETVGKLQKELPQVTSTAVDIADWAATKCATESFGDIDHLVNNAGIGNPQTFLDSTKDSFALHFDVNVGSIMNITKLLAEQWISRGHPGTVVNNGSVLGRKDFPGAVSYCATKAALESLTRSMAVELGRHNIRVNAVLPGFVKTDMLILLGEDAMKAFDANADKTVIKRYVVECDE